MSTAPKRSALRDAPEYVPGYRDLRRIGRGGFSVVYRAVQESVGRTVAVKVLTGVGPDEDARRRFVREVRLAGRLSGHPHVVTVLEAGTTVSGRPFLAMELYEGGSMTERLARGGPLDPVAAAAVGAKIADALAAAHALGVLHRDVKPNNILVSRYGEPALADFGVSCLLDASSSGSLRDAFSPRHAAPELMATTRGVPSVACDVYSLGSTLYELLTGRPPFGGPGQDVRTTMFRVVNEPVPRVECPGLPGLADVVERAMAKDPERRFPDAAAFARALRALPDATDEVDFYTDSENSPARADDTVLRPERVVPGRIVRGVAGGHSSSGGRGSGGSRRRGPGERGASGGAGRARKLSILAATAALLAVATWAVVTSQGSAAPRDGSAGQAPATSSSTGPATDSSTESPSASATRATPSTRSSTSATPKGKQTSSSATAPVSASAPPPVTNTSGPLIPGTFHRLQNAASGDCLAQPAGSGAAASQACAASRSEGWKYSVPLTGLLGAVTGQSELVNGLSGDCLTAAPGGQLGVRSCTGDPAQLWSKAAGSGAATEFRNLGDGQCLKAAQGAVAEGPCDSSDQTDLWAEDGTV